MTSQSIYICAGLLVLCICAQATALECYFCGTPAEPPYFPSCEERDKWLVMKCSPERKQCVHATGHDANNPKEIRGCSTNPMKLGCETVTKDGVTATGCGCDTDLCNSAAGNYPGMMMLLAPLAALYLKLFT